MPFLFVSLLAAFRVCDTPGAVRIGLLGPAEGDVASLGRASEFLLNTAKVSRAIYLGVDGALDRAVAAWARKLVGDDPSDEHAWRRAADVAVQGTPEQIDRFVSLERSRQRLKSLEALPSATGCTMEMVADRVAVLVFDKANLDEEDILAANILVFGKSDAPLVKKIGARWFVSPGVLGATGGVGVLDDEREEIQLTFYTVAGTVTGSHVLNVARATRMRVQGEP